MVKTAERKDAAKKATKKSGKKNKEVSESATKLKQKKKVMKKKQQAEESDDDYELPNPAFECPDENAEQALSASFIELYEKKQEAEAAKQFVKLTEEQTEKKVSEKSRKKSQKDDVVENEKSKATKKRKQNKENDDSNAKKAKTSNKKKTETVNVNATEEGKRKLPKKIGSVKVEVGSIVEPEEKREKRDVKKRKVSTTKKEESSNDERDTDESDRLQKKGQIVLSIGNLPTGCNKEALNFFFHESNLFPKINLKKRPVTFENSRGEKKKKLVCKGSATLTCKSQAVADEILKLDGATMTSETGEESEVTISLQRMADPIENATKLYIGGLHPKVTETEVREAFEGEGISLVKYKRASWKGQKKTRSKGYGFVWVASPEDVNKTLVADITIEGKQLVIMHSK
ncbi:uncharacterized protein [Antedon mediterranea]|uniref:uncharacterized protein n=1 Tax=Antedon mediterranea TaxID=105859 RepID=UPI003AF51ED4